MLIRPTEYDILRELGDGPRSHNDIELKLGCDSRIALANLAEEGMIKKHLPSDPRRRMAYVYDITEKGRSVLDRPRNDFEISSPAALIDSFYDYAPYAAQSSDTSEDSAAPAPGDAGKKNVSRREYDVLNAILKSTEAEITSAVVSLSLYGSDHEHKVILVRRLLKSLIERGLVNVESKVKGKGKPANTYGLTDLGIRAIVDYEKIYPPEPPKAERRNGPKAADPPPEKPDDAMTPGEAYYAEPPAAPAMERRRTVVKTGEEPHPETEAYLHDLKDKLLEAAAELEGHHFSNTICILKEVIANLNVEALLMGIGSMDVCSRSTADRLLVLSDLIRLEPGVG